MANTTRTPAARRSQLVNGDLIKGPFMAAPPPLRTSKHREGGLSIQPLSARMEQLLEAVAHLPERLWD
jgi:hypothetical protein